MILKIRFPLCPFAPSTGPVWSKGLEQIFKYRH